MEEGNPLTLTLDQPFVTGTDDFAPFYNRLHKLNCAIILYCRSGHATFVIDLKEYEITPNTQVVLLPDSVITLEEKSEDLQISFFAFHIEILREACICFEPSFFRFLKEKPCYTPSPEFTAPINGLLCTTGAIFADADHRFCNQIARNHLQSFLFDVYDKVHHLFTHKEIKGGNRPNELFYKLVTLVHEHCCSQRDVVLYADRLYTSTKCLTSICRPLMGGSAKKVIDDFTALEIKVLLQPIDLSIQEIADRLSFPDQSYLDRYFKRHERVSPMEYRARLAGIKQELSGRCVAVTSVPVILIINRLYLPIFFLRCKAVYPGTQSHLPRHVKSFTPVRKTIYPGTQNRLSRHVKLFTPARKTGYPGT